MYYTILSALNKILEQQANLTQNNEAAITHFLDYAATNTTTIVQHKASDMILHIENDALYLSEPWASSRTGGRYYLRSLPADPAKAPNSPPSANGPIHT